MAWDDARMSAEPWNLRVLKARKHAHEVVVVDDGSSDGTGGSVYRVPWGTGEPAAMRSH